MVAFSWREKRISQDLLARKAVNEHRQKDPLVIVKKHFLFYPEYSHGFWRQGPCVPSTFRPASEADVQGCRDVTYTIPVKGCGTVKFDSTVVPGNDEADATWIYNGERPRFDEVEYPLYALLDGEGHFIDSSALGNPVPKACRVGVRGKNRKATAQV